MMKDPAREIEMLLFDAALQIGDEATRRAFLDQTCAGQAEMRTRLEQLLNAQQQSDAYFSGLAEACAAEAEPFFPTPPVDAVETIDRIGPYRLLERIDEGGCGVVFLAEQEEPVRRRVAIKVIRLGMDTERVIERFKIERQALAMMDHPYIAHVLDAGTTPTGRPYFAMEWVNGHKITDFCDENRLTIRQRLELFNRVCLAIQHAHQKGVIHRDIKPSNIIVMEIDGMAVPKVIDFGVAKATTGNRVENATFTEAEQFVGTPAYMSPEQAGGNGMDVDTRCDIYALGTLLYELLTGRPPFDPKKLQNSGVVEIRRILHEEEPRDPSAVVAALDAAELREASACRTSDPQKLPLLLRGDLDRIVMMAMAKDRQRRYGSADALAADVVRHLNNEPVLARPSSRRYRLRRLVRRNKLAFAAGSIVVVTLIAGFGTSTYMYLREKHARYEQAQLRSEAEAARTVEIKLRGQAEAREICAQAAVKLSYGQIEQADQLLTAIPPDQVPSSLEAAEAYRKVGDWHRKAGRIQQAAERFTALAGAISTVDRSDVGKISFDILPAAIATCEVGDWPRYEKVRRIALERYGETQNTIVAEQIIKACMLRPASPATMAKIARLAAFLENATATDGGEVIKNQPKSWACFSLALWNHRLGAPQQVIHWGELSMQHDLGDEDRVACVRLLLAMARQQLGETEQASKLLADAAKPIRALMESSSGKWADDISIWVGWVNAHILLNEAEAMIGG